MRPPLRSLPLTALSLALVLVSAGAAVADDPDSTQSTADPQVAARRANTLRAIALRGWILPREVDASDPKVRLLVLLPEGPLLARAVITIDGRPFREYREKMVTEALTGADRDGDGRVTWSELAELPAAGRYRQALAGSPAAFQLDDDDAVSPREMRHFFALLNGGAGLSIGPIQTTTAPGHAPLFETLDQDGNQRLTPGEMQRSIERLRRLDADDNEILDPAELVERSLRGYIPRGATRATTPAFLRHLDSATDWQELLAELRERYAGGDSLAATRFAYTPRLYEQLDANGDQQLVPAEMHRLLDLPPHLELAVRLGRNADDAKPLEVLAVDEDLQLSDQAAANSDGQLLLAFSQTLLRVSIYEMPNYASAYASQAKSLLQRYDKNKNGYVEAEEVEANQALKSQFDNWDQDGNGMVYEREILEYYQRQQEPRQHQASIAAVERNFPLLAALDGDRDGRLNLQELYGTPQELQELDHDQDGTLERGELPRTIDLVFSRSSYAYQGGRRGIRRPAFNRPNGQDAAGSSLDWFQAMDRNRDGVVSRREFLGTERQFRQLDQNGNRFLEESEAGDRGKQESGE